MKKIVIIISILITLTGIVFFTISKISKQIDFLDDDLWYGV
jgi:preprotein translocase subunit SecF